MLTTEGGACAHARIVLNYYAAYCNKFRDKFLDDHKAVTNLEDYGLKAIFDGPQVIENAFLERGPKLVTYLTEHLSKLEPEDHEAIMQLFAALPDVNLRIKPGPSDRRALLMLTPTAVTNHTLLQEVFSRSNVAEAYVKLVNSLPPQDWHVAAYLRDIARTWYARRVTG